MCGSEARSDSLFSYLDLESRVPRGHPLRTIRAIVDDAPARLDDEFAAIHVPIAWPSELRQEQELYGFLRELASRKRPVSPF